MSSKDTFTAMVPKELIEDEVYMKWEDDLDGSLLLRVQAARDTIEADGIITNVKDLGEGLYEKKWNSGLRLYFAIVERSGRKTLILLGSGKGKEQDRAISTAKQSLIKYSVVRENIIKKD